MNWKCQLVLPSLSKCNHVFSCLKLCRNIDETFWYEANQQLLSYFFSSFAKKKKKRLYLENAACLVYLL